MTTQFQSTTTESDIVGLPDNHVHVWFLPLDGLHGTDAASGEITLSPSEQRQADDFLVADDRETYLTYRRALRGVLGFYTGLAPSSIRFAESPAGKPYIENHEIEFNVSHTEQTALIAITRSRPVGIDVEEVDLAFPHLQTAESNFTAGEHEWLRALPESARARSFLRLWCARESAVKAVGTGGSATRDDVSVDLSRNHATVRGADGSPVEAQLQEIHLGPQSVAYLAHLAAAPLEVSVHDFRRIAE